MNLDTVHPNMTAENTEQKGEALEARSEMRLQKNQSAYRVWLTEKGLPTDLRGQDQYLTHSKSTLRLVLFICQKSRSRKENFMGGNEHDKRGCWRGE